MTLAPARLAAILETMVAAIEEPDAVRQRAADPRAWLSGRGLQPRDAEELAALGEQQFFVYRRLVRATLASAIAAELPRTRRVIEQRFDADVDAFLSAALPRSHYLRDVAFDFVTFAGPAWDRDPQLPAFLHDLARYELAAFEAAAARPATKDRKDEPAGLGQARPPAQPPVASQIEARVDLASPVLFDESVRLGRYRFPVHELPEEIPEPPPTIEPRATALLVYRDHELELRTLALSPLAAAIVERLLVGATLQTAIVAACEATHAALSAPLLDELAALLADYAARGILLGTAKPSASLASQG